MGFAAGIATDKEVILYNSNWLGLDFLELSVSYGLSIPVNNKKQ
jgi:hypothetical protein